MSLLAIASEVAYALALKLSIPEATIDAEISNLKKRHSKPLPAVRRGFFRVLHAQQGIRIACFVST
jgi:hypothetical protein